MVISAKKGDSCPMEEQSYYSPTLEELPPVPPDSLDDLMERPSETDTDIEPEYDRFYRVVRKMSDLYVGYRQRYVMMVPSGNMFVPKDRATGRYLQFVDRTIYGHLNQRYAISVFAGPRAARFMCFDVDSGGLEVTRKILDLILELGIPKNCVAVSSSGGKGYHVEIFFKDYAYLNHIFEFYSHVLYRLNLDPRKIEWSPTDGHAIKLPLSKNFKTGNSCWYLDLDTFEPIQSWDGIFRIEQMDREEFVRIVENLPRKILTKTRTEWFFPLPMTDAPNVKVDVAEATDCEMRLTEPGHCFLTMRKIAIHERNRGKFSEEELTEYLENWVAQQDEDCITDSPKTIRKQIDGLVGWVFGPKFRTKKCEKKDMTETPLTSQDFALCLQQKTKYDRVLMFVLVCFAKKFGSARVAMTVMSDQVGAIPRTVQHAMQRMETSGELKCVHGKRIPGNDSGRRSINIYNPVFEKADASRFAFKKDLYMLPADFNLAEKKWFADLFYRVAAEMVEEGSLVEVMTESEIKMLKENYKNDNDNE